MSINSFLYRRLARFITCEIPMGGFAMPLPSKYDVASFGDVFCHPFYWQLYAMLNSKPSVVVDCGGHLGHFCLLADQCIRTKFGKISTSYTIIEPNPALQNSLHRNLIMAGLDKSSRVIQGMLGEANQGEGELWTNNSNFLSSSSDKKLGHKSQKVAWVSLDQIVGSNQIDILKIDIEGAEYDLLPKIPQILLRTQIVLIELHDNEKASQEYIISLLINAGLTQFGAEFLHEGHRLLAYNRV